HLLRFIGILGLTGVVGKESFSADLVAWTYAAVALLISLVGGYQLVVMARGRMVLEGHDSSSLTDASSSVERPGALRVAALTWPFGLAGLFHLIYYQSDLVLLKYL